MAKYKVEVIELLLKNNTVAKYGELVEETQLNSKTEDLEKNGFVKKATKSDLEEAKKTDEEKEEDSQAAAAKLLESSARDYTVLTKDAMSKELTEREIEHDPKANNDVLIALLKTADEAK